MWRGKQQLIARSLDYTGLGAVLRYCKTWKGLLILNYHRVGDPRYSLFDRNLYSADLDDFDYQMCILAHWFDIVSPKDLPDILTKKRGRYVMVTFDDGYRDNYTDAVPIMRTYGITGTFFLTTGFLDRHRLPWWDEIAWMVHTARTAVLPQSQWVPRPYFLDEMGREDLIRRLLKIYKRLRPHETENYLDFLAEGLRSGRVSPDESSDLWMTWDMVRDMASSGFTIGGHSHTHPVLANLSSEEQEFEVRQCTERITKEMGTAPNAFSYPVGGPSAFNEQTRELLSKYGYDWGFAYAGGYHRPGPFDPFALKRTAVESDMNAAIFRGLIKVPQIFA